jgi:hypothetical protein
MSRPVGMLALAELAAHAVPDDGASDGEIARAIARATVAP